MNFSSTSDDFIDSAQLLPYPTSYAASSPHSPSPSSSTPISMSLTEFHFVLLYKDRIVGVCNLNDALVYEELLPLVSGYDEHVLAPSNSFIETD